MANKLKSKKEAVEKEQPLKQEKEETVEVKQLLKDERTHKIAGSILLLISFLLFVAFTSYLFTWEEDQDKVFKNGYRLLLGNDVKVSNLLGTLGAFLAHSFIYKGFGIASYLICTFFFVLGVNLFFGKKIFSPIRNIKYLIIGLPLLSVLASVLFSSKAFAWGGAVGDMCKDWMYKVIGEVGTYGILLVAGISYVIWRFNPAFKLPAKKINKVDEVSNEIVAVTGNKEVEVDEEDDDENEQTNTSTITKGNILKGEGNVLVIPPQDNPLLNHDINLVEKEDKGIVIQQPEIKQQEIIITPIEEPKIELAVTPPPTKKVVDNASLELEIKTKEDEIEEPEEIIESKPTVSAQPYDPILDLRDYKYPTLDLLENHGSEKIIQDANELENNKNQIINTLKNYDINIQKISATVGPTVTLYEIIPAAGVRISRIKNLEDDIALSLAALGIRIIAPIPGKGTIGIEVPNAKKTVVSMKTLLASEKFQQNKFSLPIAIGKKIDNENFIVDLASMPHLLMAGATGQGKSVGLNAILVSLLYKKHPSQLKFVLVDPKKVELSIYRTIEKHFLAKLPGEDESIITDTKKVIHTLNALCIEMDNRYDLLKEAGVRNIKEYNEKFAARKLNPEKGHQFLPFIVLVVDEFADLIMTAGKEVEMPIARLAQLARAVGVHLIIATQRPSVNIITGTIKANFPARIAFKVSSKIDSRTILDTGGAEQLIGKGDMLISYNGEVVRLQCAFVDTPEVDKIVDFIGEQRGYPQAFLLPEYVDEKEMEKGDFDVNDKDPLFEDAARLIVTSQIGSTSLLQRRMKLGYNRAGRLMDQLEAAGVVGGNQGSKARDVLIKTEMDLQMLLDSIG
ncbi:MAG: DNA translocase FtsK 4TM domain-containing protein [Ferruginibacter sp.]|nr:DNA translocase FtsK 4TM domain-containing protein [Ferruginibacter sp.]